MNDRRFGGLVLDHVKLWRPDFCIHFLPYCSIEAEKINLFQVSFEIVDSIILIKEADDIGSLFVLLVKDKLILGKI